jgi:hypothetical protein
MPINENEYFAATEDIYDLASEIVTKVDDYMEYLLTSGKAHLWNKVFETYYSGQLSLGMVQNSGDHGEFTNLEINHFKSLLTHLLVMTTNQRPALDPRAINTDTESTAQCKLAQGLLDYYMREKKVERFLKDAVGSGLKYAEGFVVVEWDSTGGEEYGVNPETGAVIREGDLKFTGMMPHFVVRDFNKMDSDHHDWVVLVRFENKYNLAAKYPDMADDILDLSSEDDMFIKLKLSRQAITDTEDIPIYTFYHRRNNALPNGRMTEVLNPDIVLFDGPIPYRDIPVYRLSPEDQDLSIFGYTVGYDLLAIQDAINALYSTVSTNISTFGVQSVLIPRGFNISVHELTGGLNLIEYDPKVGKPEPLQLTLTAPEVYNFIAQLERLMETLSGINQVARGNPEANLKSGNALALVQSMAIQFNSGLQQSYTQLLEDVGTAIINILKDFAEVPRIAMIAGKYNRSYMKEFSGKDLKQVNRVVVDAGNPLSKTLSGKMQIADNLLAAGFIKDPQQYEMVLMTGNLDYILEGDQKELYQIRQENEMMTNGDNPPVMITDAHAKHINEHKAVLSSPESRLDPKVVGATTAHIQEHISQLKSADPELLKILGQEPIASAPPAMPGAVEGMASKPGDMGAVAGGPVGVGPTPPPEAAMVGPMNPVTNKAAQINMPSMPRPPEGTDPQSAAIIDSMGQ